MREDSVDVIPLSGRSVVIQYDGVDMRLAAPTSSKPDTIISALLSAIRAHHYRQNDVKNQT
jgi:hypothetical protein